MKSLLLAVVCALCACVGGSVQGSVFVTVDELGQGSWVGDVSGDGHDLLVTTVPGGGIDYWPVQSGTIPGASPAPMPGIVLMNAPGSAIPSDVVVFGVNAPYTLRFISNGFDYSANQFLPTSLADTQNTDAQNWFITACIGSDIAVIENSLGIASYHPLAGQPGFIAGRDVYYTFISEVPEPATLSLLALGGLAVIRRRRRSVSTRKASAAKPLLLIVVCAIGVSLMGASAARAEVIAQWTFEQNYTPPADLALSVDNIAAEVGSGTARGAHGPLAAFTMPVGNGSSRSLSSDHWGSGSMYGFAVSTVGFKDITIAWDQASSNTGPGEFWLTQTSGLGDFVLYSYTVHANASPNPTWSSNPASYQPLYHYSFDLSSATILNNQASVELGLFSASTVSASGGSVGTGGTSRVDNVTISGTPIPEPATLSLLALGGLAMIRRGRRAATK